MKFLPHAIYKFFENIPNPWEEAKSLRAIYHTSGALTIITDIPKVIEPVYKTQWSLMWIAMRREKRDRNHFKRVRFPPFDDEQPPLSYGEKVLGIEPQEAITFDLDENEDAEIIDWIFDGKPLEETGFVNGESYRKYKLSLEMIKNLNRLSFSFQSEIFDKNSYFLFDMNFFKNAKALNLAIPGGPKFEPLFKDLLDDYEDDWNEFNDLEKIIFRHPLRTEYKIAFPHCYNSRPRQIIHCIHQRPLSAYAKSKSFDEMPFKFHENIHPLQRKYVSAKHQASSITRLNKLMEKNEAKIKPFLSDFDHFDEKTLSGISLLFAPKENRKLSSKTKRSSDIKLINHWYKEKCPLDKPVKTRVSYQKLLKQEILANLHHKKPVSKKKVSLLKEFEKTKYFQVTELDWVEAGLQVVRQGFNMMNLIIHKRNLTFLHLDYNFILKPVKTLTTKERKKSRFGNAFHLMREVMRLTKFIVDLHAKNRMGEIDSYQLADALQYVFSHVASLTGIYRYKYKVMKQVRMCKDIKHVIYDRFNTNLGKGPGCGFWQPVWRVWLFFLRGTIPLLERWLGNLLARQFEGRAFKNSGVSVTKQRIEPNFDLELRTHIIKEITDMMPEGLRSNKSKTILQHLSEAWRCWKANIKWSVPNMPPQIEGIINKYIGMKSEWWTNQAKFDRKRIRHEDVIDRTISKKNIGRLTRLYMMEEQKRQKNYLQTGPFISKDEAIKIYQLLVDWLDQREFKPIPFPPVNYKHDTKLFVLALEGLKESFSVKSRLNQNQRDQLAFVEQAFDNPHEALSRVKRQLLTQRTFKEVKIQFMDLYSHIFPIYELDPLEKITDSYLDQFISYEASKRNLFPNWIKPSDQEPTPLLVYKFCESINNVKNIWNSDSGEMVVLLQTKFERMFEKVDLTLMNKLLRLVMDHNLADYMTSKHNVNVNFKDMNHVNSYGLLHGVNFSGFMIQFWGFIIDLIVMGLNRASEIQGSSLFPNEFGVFENEDLEQRHPLKRYCRYIDKVYMVFKFSNEEAEDLVQRYLEENPEESQMNLKTFPTKKCWPKDQRMRLMKFDVVLGRALFWEIQNKLLPSMTSIEWKSTFISVYSQKNPNLLFDMCGFEVRILPKIRTDAENLEFKDGIWKLINQHSKELTALAHVKVSKEYEKKFENRIRQIVIASGSATFTKICNKWNTSLIGLLTYFREAIANTESLIDIIVKSENKIQNRIKSGINSKMPSRFPPCVFYAPKELGGLGMLSMAHILIPQADLFYSKQTKAKITHFRAGMGSQEEKMIPNLYRYIQTWESEFRDSKRVWSEYAVKRQMALENNTKIDIYDIEDSWDFGVPRINTLFQKDRMTLAYDKGWRLRQEFRQYQIMKQNPLWWTHQRHDGKLWNLNNYRNDVIESLGGIESILEHSLFKGTYFQSWEGLFWEKTSGFEESAKYKKLTNAQRSGLNQIPNRRFTLWWSPTINRANVYIGFTVQLDLTGIMMHGKLPTLKSSLIQIFRAHLWQKIHESLVLDYCNVLDLELNQLDIEKIQKETIHPRKSYKLEFSCADIVLHSSQKWMISKPSLLNSSNDQLEHQGNKFWIDIQLRWGDYDSHDIERYSRAKYLEYTTDQMSLYPSAYGVVVAYDLSYNLYSAFGNWFPGLKQVILESSAKIMNQNPSLFVLRERVRNALQLHSTEPNDPYLSTSNYSELFSNQKIWIIDDSQVYRVVYHKTLEGNVSTKPVNGVLFIFEPKTGKIYAKIFHSSLWTGQKRRAPLAKWKAAEEVFALVRSLPEEERPRKLIVMRKSLLDPLEMQLIDFPNIIIKGSEIQIPFQSLLKLGLFGQSIMNATAPEMLIHNLYDNWMETISNFTCFNRSILIMRALHVNSQKTSIILKEASKVNKEPTFVWPKVDLDNWLKVEIELRNLILADFANRCNVNISSLISSEIQDIILGMETAEETIAKRQTDDIKRQKLQNSTVLQTVNETVNKQGEKIVVSTVTPYEQEKFTSSQNWRVKANASKILFQRAQNIVSQQVDKNTNPFIELTELPAFIFSEELLKKFIEISDLKVRIIGLLFGESQYIDEQNLVNELKIMTLPVQSNVSKEIQFHQTLADLEEFDVPGKFMGLIYTSSDEERELNPYFLLKLKQIMDKNQGFQLEDCCIINLSYPLGSAVLNCFKPTKEGADWIDFNQKQNWESQALLDTFERIMYLKCPIWVSNVIKGLFLEPNDGKWNCNMTGYPRVDSELEYKIGNPSDFYNESNRLSHFVNFCRNQDEEFEDDEIVN